MGFGHDADLVAGQLSRILHGLRGPKHNTVPDLTPYLDRSIAELCPEPPPLENLKVHGSVAARVLRTTTLSWQSTHVPLSSRYRERHEGEYRANKTAWARWLRPDGVSRRNCLIYIHGWLEPGSWLEEAFVFPTWVRMLDVDVVHVALPFHGRRNPRGALFSGEYFWTADLVRSLEGARQAVHDARAMMGWLRRQGYAAVGVTGVSLGGSLAMLMGCLTPLPDYLIPIVAHLRLADAVENASILWRMKRDLENWGVYEPDRRRIFERIGLDRARPLLSPERQLWIEAVEDAHIDPVLVRSQWEEWGRPEVHWLPGGHMTFPLHLPEITTAMRRFLAERFA
jgi:pimeloyl-ACP methyl ester carboxylesterase